MLQGRSQFRRKNNNRVRKQYITATRGTKLNPVSSRYSVPSRTVKRRSFGSINLSNVGQSAPTTHHPILLVGGHVCAKVYGSANQAYIIRTVYPSTSNEHQGTWGRCTGAYKSSATRRGHEIPNTCLSLDGCTPTDFVVFLSYPPLPSPFARQCLPGRCKPVVLRPGIVGDARVYRHMTTAMHDMSTRPPMVDENPTCSVPA